LKYLIVGNDILAPSCGFRLLERMEDHHGLVIVGPKIREGCAILAAGSMLNSYAGLNPLSLASEYSRYLFELSGGFNPYWPTGTVKDTQP
jgi:hypothetical protein